jgi:hypothetical protein
VNSAAFDAVKDNLTDVAVYLFSEVNADANYRRPSNWTMHTARSLSTAMQNANEKISVALIHGGAEVDIEVGK